MNKTSISRRLTLAALGLAVGLTGAGYALTKPAVAQNYPSGPITMLVPFSTGGYNDRLARAMAPHLSRELGVPVTVENRPGAGGMLGHTQFLQMPDDGHVILVSSIVPYVPLTVFVHGANYDLEDFWAINLPSRDATFGATARNNPRFENFGQIMEALQADPRSLSIGVQPASADLVNLSLILDAFDISLDDVRLVTYPGGGPLRTAMVGGHVDIGFVGHEGTLPLASELRALIMFADEVHPAWEGAVTQPEFLAAYGKEAQMVPGSMRGYAVHRTFKENHPERYEILYEALNAVSHDPDVVAQFDAADLATHWFGDQESNESFLAGSRTLGQYVDLLKSD